MVRRNSLQAILEDSVEPVRADSEALGAERRPRRRETGKRRSRIQGFPPQTSARTMMRVKRMRRAYIRREIASGQRRNEWAFAMTAGSETDYGTRTGSRPF